MQRIAVVVIAVVIASACGSGSKDNGASQPAASPPPTSPAPTTHVTGTTATTVAPNVANARVSVVTVASGLDSPVDIAWRKGDPRMYVVEQRGRVRIIGTNGRPLAAPVLTIAVSHGNEQGLLGATFSPDGTKLYVDYTDPDGDTHVDEYTMSGDVAGGRRQLLFQRQPFPNHNGGEVIIGPDGMLYIGLGDGGGSGDPFGNAQKLNTLLGKILRINPAPANGAPYTVAADNPFVGRSGARPEIYVYGLRNPWRFSFDRATGALWIGDVGQNAYEEIDTAAAGDAAGVNWGWNLREGFHEYKGSAPPGARDPVIETSHHDDNCAIIGGYVYRGRAIPALEGAYLYGDSCNPPIVAAFVSNGKAVQAPRTVGRVEQLTSFGEDPNGEQYVVSRTGTISRLDPA
jgi:glucose/arabinose dehydrogenase